MKIFLFFFWRAIKIAGSAQKNRVGQVSGNTDIFFFRPHYILNCEHAVQTQFRHHAIVASALNIK